MNKILEFPYGRIRQEVESHEAKILQLPVKHDPLLLPFAFALAWMSLFKL